MTTMTISKELLDELLSGVERPEDFFGDTGLMKELKVRLMERMLGAELTEHPSPPLTHAAHVLPGSGQGIAQQWPERVGCEPNTEPVSQQYNRRNGTTRKTLKGNDGAVPIDIPRDHPSRRCRLPGNDRSCTSPVPETDQNQGRVSKRKQPAQAAVYGHPERINKLDHAAPKLEFDTAPTFDLF